MLLNPPMRGGRKFIREGRCTQEKGAWGTLWPPISLATIGAVLENDEYEVQIIDCAAKEVTFEKLKETIKDFSPQAIIWSSGTPTIESDLALASFIKEIDKTIKTVVFGTHVSVLDTKIMQTYKDLDSIVRNEPELTCQELIKTIAKDEDLTNVKGITFRDSKNQIVKNEARPFIDDLDSLPYPAWHLLELEHYRLPVSNRRFLMVSPLRGCPFRCSFCTCRTYYGGRSRKRSIESVIGEIEHNIEKFGIRNIFFWADTFVIDKDYVRALCNTIIEKKINVSWVCNSRVDTVDESLLELMAKSGCWMISYGIESSDQGILNGVNKGVKVEQAGKAVEWTKNAGIQAVGHFILGLPGETEETLKKTIEYSMTLDLDFAQYYSATPFPGSKLYDQALSEGWITDEGFDSFKQDSSVMMLPSLHRDKVNYYRKLGFKRFYMGPKMILKMIKMGSVANFKNLWKLGKGFLKWTGK